MFLNPQTGISKAESSKKSAILLIDDEELILESSKDLIEMLGYSVVIASSVHEAEKILTQEGTRAFDCVITDYKMPGKTGLELLEWLRQFDPNISIIVNTGYAGHKDVAAMLRHGALDVLNKPVPLDQLRMAVEKGVGKTKELREQNKQRHSILQVAEVYQYLFQLHGVIDSPETSLCFVPMHQAGGDFVIMDETVRRRLLMVADVSGHDLDSAYLSAYMQGAATGLLKGGYNPARLINELNHFLLEKWNARGFEDFADGVNEASVCCLLIEMNRSTGRVVLHNNGIPEPIFTRANGRSEVLGFRGCPIGLYDETETELIEVPGIDGELLIWSDGLEDFARELQIADEALAYRLLLCENREEQIELLDQAEDDVLVVRQSVKEGPAQFRPIIVYEADGGQACNIDTIEDYWSRSIMYALPDISEEILYGILLVSREGFLNAIRHGCKSDPEKTCQIQMHYHPDFKTFRIMISDPGEGYDDTYLIDEEPDLEKERNCGLILMRNFPDSVALERRGATVIMDFYLNKPENL